MKKIEERKKEVKEVKEERQEGIEEKKEEKKSKEAEVPPPADVLNVLTEARGQLLFDENPWLEEEVQKKLLERVQQLEENKIRIETVLLGKRLQQKVPITPELTVTYQSMLGEEDLAIKERLREAADQLELYFGTLQMFYMLAVTVSAVNGVELSGGLKDSPYTWEEIQKRFRQLSRYPVDLLMALSGGMAIFQKRMQAFFSPKRLVEQVKNG